MAWFGELWRRLLFLFRREGFDRDLQDEMRFHLEMKARDNREAGLDEDEAAYAARRRFGNATRLEERSREAWGWGWLERVAQDVRYALRTMRRNTGYTAVAAVTLALGIGANTAIFSVTNALLLRMLPVPHPEELRFVVQRFTAGNDSYSYSYPAYKLLRERSRTLEAISAVDGVGRGVVSGVGEETERASRQFVSGDFFSTLGIRPFAGRFFTPEDDRKGVAVISYAYWRRKFQGAAALGAGITVDETPLTIAGIAPPGFSGTTAGQPTDIWIPAMMMSGCVSNINCQTFRALVRLKPGVTEAQASAELGVLLNQHLLERARGITNEHDRRSFLDRRTFLVAGGAGDSSLGRQYQKPLTLLMVLVGLVLLLACANVANMLLARANSRAREIAVRLAIGVGRRRLMQQLLTESLLLGALGGALGLLVALWGARALIGLFPQRYGIVLDVNPDLRVLAFTAAISLCSGLLFGLAPAWRAARSEVAPVLKANAAGGGRAGRCAVSRTLVVSQVALSIVLLAGAGLFVRTLSNLRSLDAGFEREGVVSFSAGTPRAWKPDRTAQARQRLLEEVGRLPGVVAAATVGPPPLTGMTWDGRIGVEGYPERPEEDMVVNFMAVSPGFAETMRTRLLSGRMIGPEDRKGAPVAVVVNQAFARYFFGGANPLGRYIQAGFDLGRVEIVGVVEDARFVSLRERAPRMIWVSSGQVDFPIDAYVARAAGDPRALESSLRQTARRIDPALRVDNVRTLDEQLEEVLTNETMLARLSGFFGLLAVLMAALGLYGVMSYSVAQRTGEIGIRMALGAARGAVLGMVMREACLLVAAGAVVGVPAVLLCGRFVRSMLFGLEPADPGTLAVCSAVLFAVALTAAFLPGRRAMRVEPVAALRCE